MERENPYRTLFANWPEALSRRGIVITTLNEAVVFKSFMIKNDLLMLERQAPDALGARFVMVEYHTIAALKIIDPLKADSFASMGFKGKLSLA